MFLPFPKIQSSLASRGKRSYQNDCSFEHLYIHSIFHNNFVSHSRIYSYRRHLIRGSRISRTFLRICRSMQLPLPDARIKIRANLILSKDSLLANVAKILKRHGKRWIVLHLTQFMVAWRIIKTII